MAAIENQEELQKRLESFNRDADKTLTFVHYISIVLLFMEGLIYGRLFLAISAIIFISLLFFSFKHLAYNRMVKNILLSISLIFWPLLMIAVSGGAVEMRYIYLAYLFLIVIYQDIVPMLLLIGLAAIIVVTYSLSIINDTSWALFMGNYLLEPSHATLSHMFITLFILFACGGAATYLNIIFRKRTIKHIKNEIDQEKQLNIFNKNKIIADEIARGNLEKEEIEQEAGEEINDDLGYALDNMRKALKEASEKDKVDKFINIGLAEIAEILRNHSQDIDDLSDHVLRHLVKYLGVNQGGLFVLEKEEENEPYLELKACYAFNKKKYMEKRLNIGQGLAGQVVKEKDTIYLKEIPQDYVYITSGLGEATPSCLVVVPLMINEEVEGVIELASFRELSQNEVHFVEKVGQSIASSIASVKVNTRTKRLLEESQQQAEEMRAQEEEMRQNTEELQATQEEMQRKEEELNKKYNEALQELEEKNVRQNLDEIALEIEESIKYASHELRFLSKIPSMEAIFKAKANEDIDPDSGERTEVWIERFDMIISNLMANKELYYQIILTDLEGHYLFAKKYINNKVQNMTGDSYPLQDTPLLKNTLKLEQDEVYTGHIKFSKENKDHAVIALGIPVFAKGKLKGGLFLDLYCDEFIGDLKSRENGQGYYYLMTPEGNKLYGNSQKMVSGKKIEKTVDLNARENIQLVIGHTWDEVREA